MNDDVMARAALRGCQAQLRAAYLDAHGAASHLTGARATMAGELADQAADALADCERLILIITGDAHPDRRSAGVGEQAIEIVGAHAPALDRWSACKSPVITRISRSQSASASAALSASSPAMVAWAPVK